MTDLLILHSLSVLSKKQDAPTSKTVRQFREFLDYMATYPDATIRYYTSDMVLNTHSDASYLTASKGRSRAGGQYFLGSIPNLQEPIQLNGPIHSLGTILRIIAASAAGAELGALFLNTQQAK